MMPYVLTIGGSDSSGAAGVQADLKTFAAWGVYGLSALTLVTAQNSAGINALQVLDSSLIEAQIAALAGLHIASAKTGLLLNSGVVKTVRRALHLIRSANPSFHLVIDPVLVAGDGRRLTDDETIDAYRALIADRSLTAGGLVLTPNTDEAELLTGLVVENLIDMRKVAFLLHTQYGVPYVLVKGGHLGSDPIIDVLYYGSTFHELHAARLPANNPRGAGDTYSACIAAEIAKGADVISAVHTAKSYVSAAIQGALAWQISSAERGLLDHNVAKG